MHEDDRAKLQEFVSSVYEDLNLVASKVDILVPESKELHELLGRAWEDVSPRFQQIVEYLAGKRPLEQLAEQLEERGLVGIQLELKLWVYRLRRNEFTSEWGKFEEASKEEKKNKRGFIGGIIQRLLRIIDRILDSLGFIPGTDAVKEVKGIIEEII